MLKNILTIDLEVLKLEIIHYEYVHCRKPDYIIMNIATLRLIKQQVMPIMEFTKDMLGNDYLFGIAIATCEGLVLGQIDVK